MKELYRPYMTRRPEITFHDVAIESLTLEALRPFADADGAFRKSFDVTLKDPDFDEIWILSTVAQYESEGEAIPAVQMRLINEEGKTNYYSPVYEIGHKREMYRREWRLPPAYKNFNILRISFLIPEGVTLHLQKICKKANTRYRRGDFGIRYHGHAGFPGAAPSNTALSFQLAAEMGFTSCITIPKFTKDGLGICFHDDSSIRNEIRYDDGSIIPEGGEDDRPIREFTYEELMKFDKGIKRSTAFAGTRMPTMDEFFRICSLTGMDPIFSVHPALTKEQWLYVRKLLEKYRLLEHFWIKMSHPEKTKPAVEVFDDEIAGYILIQGVKQDWDPDERVKEIGLDRNRHNIVVEFFHIPQNEDTVDEKIRRARAEGYPVSVAAMLGGVSGVTMQKLIDIGVSEFTLDYHCSMGLVW